MYRIESFLSARLFIVPQSVGERLYFLSNLSGRLSLYAMQHGGSVPQPLLPPHIALQNPHLMNGYSFYVFPQIGKILVMIDRDGDENYQPMLIPLEGGYPEAAFGEAFASYRVHLLDCDLERNLVYLAAESRQQPLIETYRADLKSGQLTKLAESAWGRWHTGHSEDHARIVLAEAYTMGDVALFLWEGGEQNLLFGKPLEQRAEGEAVPLSGIRAANLTSSGKGVLMMSALFADTYSLGYLDLSRPQDVQPVEVRGAAHTGAGEMAALRHLRQERYLLGYNIDGCSWLYEGVFEEDRRLLVIEHVLVGQGELSQGVLEHVDYEEAADRFALSFSTATSPTQIYTIEGRDRKKVVLHTAEKILGVAAQYLSPGEDASFISFDGTRVSARLYLPAPALGFTGPRPVVYYVHGGPQSQERPDFAWFSMPLIQFMTLRGFAVFVPNVRGSTGYGLAYTKQVDRDWGGQDRLDHVHAMTEVLPQDKRLDVERAAPVGRSYGGYMTLMLAGRHPDLWKAACDMFGPYDLITFLERIPETWKPYFAIALGDSSKPEDREFLEERSPRSYLDNMTCPMLVIQGRNDPRVVAAESEDLVNDLRGKGKDIELLVFEDEGHDVLKYENRVRCYNGITDFFAKYLKP